MLLEWHRRLKIIQQFIISEYNKRLVLKTVKNLNYSKLLPNALHGCILFLIVLETTAKGDPGAESSSTLAVCMAWLDCRKELEWVLLFHSQKLSEEPLLRASPEELDSDLLVNTQWKLLTDFILQKDAEHRSHQQLVNIKIHKGWLTDIMFYCCSLDCFGVQLSLSKEGPCSAGSEVVSISAQQADTRSSRTASPADISE